MEPLFVICTVVLSLWYNINWAFYIFLLKKIAILALF